MAQYVLANDIMLTDRGLVRRLPAGKIIDDRQFNIALLQTLGALLVPVSGAALARSAQLLKQQRRGLTPNFDIATRTDSVDPFLTPTVGSSPTTRAYANESNSPYLVLATDDLIFVDNSVAGAQVTVLFEAAPAAGAVHQVIWWKSMSPPGRPPIVSGNGAQIADWNSASGFTSIGPTTSITALGSSGKWEFVAAVNGNPVNAWILVV
jgi:hypothetical protein